MEVGGQGHTVKLTHMVDDGNGGVMIDDNYREFLEEETDAYGEAVLRCASRIQPGATDAALRCGRREVE